MPVRCSALPNLGATVASAEAQVACGQITTQNDIFQKDGLMRVVVLANTTREVVLCPLELHPEAWVEGPSNGAASPTQGPTIGLALATLTRNSPPGAVT
jgi:hypothetical protein